MLEVEKLSDKNSLMKLDHSDGFIEIILDRTWTKNNKLNCLRPLEVRSSNRSSRNFLPRNLLAKSAVPNWIKSLTFRHDQIRHTRQGFYIKSSAAHNVSLLIRNDIKAVQTLKDQWVAETFQWKIIFPDLKLV